MDETSRALPREWISRLFLRFRSMYGNRMETMWGTADASDLEEAWAEELWPFDGVDLREALAQVSPNYPDYPPTLPQFTALCRDAKRKRGQAAVKLEAPRGEVDRAFVERVVAGVGKAKEDPKAWARKILEREAKGERMPMYAVQCAREVVGCSN